jgi:cytochrome c553
MKRFPMLPPLLIALIAAAAPVHAAETAQAPYQGDAAKGQPIASTVCGACHGPDGNSVVPVNPKLAGQNADYLFKQMRNFKGGGTDGKPARTNAIMNGMIAAYSEDQMRDFAAYFSSQVQNGGVDKDRDTVAIGQKLYRAGDMARGLPACAGCHGPTGAGIPAEFPRVGGQWPDYLEAQLKAFRAAGADPKDPNGRDNDPNKMMRMIAVKMTDPEIKAVANYMSGLH